MQPKKFCSNCRKIKGLNCDCPEKKPFEGINRSNYAFYNNSVWRKLSKAYKIKNPLCVMCLQKGRVTPVDVTDHVVSIDDGGAKLDESNLQSLCHTCHNSKTGSNKRK